MSATPKLAHAASESRSDAPPAPDADGAAGPQAEGAELFAGRQDALARLFDAVATPGRHALIYGEQGIGKSAFLETAVAILQDCGVGVLRARGRPGTELPALIRESAAGVEVAPDMEMRFAPVIARAGTAADPDDDMREPLAALLPEAGASPSELAALFDTQLAGPFAVIIDDFDRIGSAMVDRAAAELMRALGDSGSATTVILAGRGDSGEDLLANRDMVYDVLRDVPLRLLRPEEILHTLERLAGPSGLAVTDDTKKLLITASMGLPGMVHELSGQAIAAALSAGADTIEPAHFVAALNAAIAAGDPAVREAFEMLVGEDSDDDFARTLYAIAVAHTDWYGRFFKSQIAQSLRSRFPELAQEEAEVVAFLDSLTGTGGDSLFLKHGTEYRFRDIRMKQFLIMVYLAKRFGVWHGTGSDGTASALTG